MNEFLILINDLYEAIYKNGLEDYKRHLFDTLYIAIDMLYKKDTSHTFYISILELINLVSVFDIKNDNLNKIIFDTKMAIIDKKRFETEIIKFGLDDIFCPEFQKLTNGRIE